MPLIRKISAIICLLFLTALRVYTPAEGGIVSTQVLSHSTLSSENHKDKVISDPITLTCRAEEEQDHQDDGNGWQFVFSEAPVFNWGSIITLKNDILAIPVGKRAGPSVAFYLLFCSLRIPSC